MSVPTTEAGRWMLDDLNAAIDPGWSAADADRAIEAKEVNLARILAIEAEARDECANALAQVYGQRQEAYQQGRADALRRCFTRLAALHEWRPWPVC